MGQPTSSVDWMGPDGPLAVGLRDLGLPHPGCDKLTIEGGNDEPLVNSPHRLTTAMAASIALAGIAADALGQTRGLPKQHLSLNLSCALRHLHSEHMAAPTLNGRPLARRLVRDNPLLAQAYRCRDNIWAMPSALYPAGLLAWLRFLQVPPTEAAVAHAISLWSGDALEAAAAAARLPVALCRTAEAWRAHPQGQALATQPLIDLQPVGHPRAPRPLAQAARPLEGVRVLALTQAIAGPLCCRTLAEQGAQVLHVGHPEGFEHEAIWCEAYVGCRSLGLDLSQGPDHTHFTRLLRDADVLVANLSPESLARLGLSEPVLQALQPDLVRVHISAYGNSGPWSQRLGFDMNVSAAVGIMLAEGAHASSDKDVRPKLPPTVLLNDFLCGYLAAAGAATALYRRGIHGGGTQVTVSLAKAAMWCQDLTVAWPMAGIAPGSIPGEPRTLTAMTPLGVVRRLTPAMQFSHTPGGWVDPILVPRVSAPAGSGWLM